MRFAEHVFTFSKVGGLNGKILNIVCLLGQLAQRILKDTVERERNDQ